MMKVRNFSSKSIEANQKLRGVGSFFGVFTGKTQGLESVLEKAGEDFKKSLNRSTQMRQFLGRVSCNSASARQMGENFLRTANGQTPLQNSGGKLEGADRETDPLTEEDISRAARESLAHARKAANANAIREATKANEAGKGWPFYEKKVQPFENSVGVEDYDSRKALGNAPLQSALFAAKRSGQKFCIAVMGQRELGRTEAPGSKCGVIGLSRYPNNCRIF